ncbi:Valine--tRNA ligase [Hibiscus syriacus]|uniref:valine--tRNA ligase n=1 Tax=Hibiscus syriacus TaxID=106335 RepID=A0A6A2Y0P2_HIBSY|nr:Valine--tRNA ligase [Hibiscus syriacus]
MQPDTNLTEEELERKKKKAREKELKKFKASEKTKAAKLKAQQGSNAPKKSAKKSATREVDDENPEDFVDPETPSGEKKRLSSQMPKQYSPAAVLSPPNVTGALHIGHALTGAIEDTIIRWRRMSGYNTLWVTGMDHAGIATQVWKWENEYGGTILRQLRRMGASLDWSRECFTMDEKRSKAVTEACNRLYKEGLIYRDFRLVNWDCVLRTAISDIGVPNYEKPVEFGVLTSFAETMLGDTAIAIHPEDKRYSHLHGKFVIHPFNGRKLPIICDGILVDPCFGTGAVKITPVHDPNDYKVGKRHNIEYINIFTDDGKINSNGGAEFAGIPRFKAREAVIDALQRKLNFFIMGVFRLPCTPSIMAMQALDVAMDDQNRKLEFIPKQYTAEWKRLTSLVGFYQLLRGFTFLYTLSNLCYTVQLWWGHRIPAWYVTVVDDEQKELGAYNDHWIAARDEEQALAEARKKYSGKKFEMSQDPDVLDSWFSAGHDIIFFWVAQMVMLGTKLGGDVPFSKVYLHPMIRDAHGRKMSKSLGNVIDPLEVINGISLNDLHKRLEEGNLDPNEVATAKEGQGKDFPNGIAECGADALRFALVSYIAQLFFVKKNSFQLDKINLDIQRVVGYRQWCNKLWNAVRFAMSKLPDDCTPPSTINPEAMPSSCRWILSVLNKAISKTVLSLNSYEFSDATTGVYSWWQYQFCDIFIEATKRYFAGDKSAFSSERKFAQDTLWSCLEIGCVCFIRLCHSLPKNCGSAFRDWINERVEYEMDLVESTVRSLRSLRAELLAKQKNERLPAFAFCQNDEVAKIMRSCELEIITLAILSSLKVLLSDVDDAPAGSAVENVKENLKVYLKAAGEVEEDHQCIGISRESPISYSRRECDKAGEAPPVIRGFQERNRTSRIRIAASTIGSPGRYI